jgi:chemotaxis protein MotB
VAQEESIIQEEVVEEEDELKDEVVCEEGAPGWVVTFGDMMSLLLTFFILLLSFATLDKVQFDKLSGVLREGFGVISRTDTQRIPKRDTMIKITQRMNKNSRQPNSAGEDVKRLIKQISATSINDQTKRALEMLVQANNVKVSVPADDIFVPGTDQVRPRIYPMLDLLAIQAREVMSDKELSIEVRAKDGSKCDSSFLKTEGCDYWLMTAYQAIALSEYMKNKGKVSASSLAPVGRGTVPAVFLSKRERKNLSDSTVEFVYMTPPQDLNLPR